MTHQLSKAQALPQSQQQLRAVAPVWADRDMAALNKSQLVLFTVSVAAAAWGSEGVLLADGDSHMQCADQEGFICMSRGLHKYMNQAIRPHVSR